MSGRRQWALILSAVLFLAGGFTLAAGLLSDGPELEVISRGGYPGAQGLDEQMLYLTIQSREERRLTVRKVKINGRDDCVLTKWSSDVALDLGESIQLMLACDPVKVFVATDRGTSTYWMEHGR